MEDDLKHCAQCHGPLIEIDHYGERLIGCIDCNCWQSSKSAFIAELSLEDIQALRDGRRTPHLRRRDVR
jgi:hypothetical protein